MSSVIGNLRVVLGLDSAAFQKGMTDAAASLKKIGAEIDKIGRSLSVRVTAPVLAFGALTLKTAADFQTAMNKVAAVSGATGDELAALSKQARDLGATTQFSASEAAEAMNFLAMAGYRTDQILGAMPDTLRLASAAQLDMASAADIVTNIMAGYSMEVADLAHANDVLVKAFTSANTDLRQLGEALKYAGPVANAAGVEFEEAAAALGMMGNAGIQASMAGTSLRGAISRILSPTKKMQTIMDEAGLSFTDAHGRILPLADIIEQLEPHADNAGMMMELFGQRAGPAMAALVSQGSDALRDLTAELRDSGGTAERVSKVQMEGLNGALKELRSVFEELQLKIAESGLLEWAEQFVKWLTRLVQRISQASPEMLRWGIVLSGIAAAMGPVLIGLGVMVSGAGALAGAFGALVPVVSAVAAGIAALSAPVAAAVAVIAGAAYLVWENWEKVGPWFTDLFRGLMDTFAGLAEFIVGLVNADLSMASAGLQRSWEGLQLFFETLWEGVVAAFKWAKEQIQPIIDWFDEAVDRIDRGLNRITGANKDGPISSGPYTGGATGPVLPGTSVPFDMQRGLQAGTAGIRAQGVTDAEAYGDGFREGMGIRSPSRVMIEIGEYLSQGLGIGIEKGQPHVQNASENVGQSFSDSIMPYFEGVIRGTSSVREAFSSMLQDMASQLMSSGLHGLLGSLFGGGGFFGLRIPGFATNGQHGGGWRIVGERGPELEATGPARYYPAAQTQPMRAGGGAGGELDVRLYIDNGGNWQAEVARIAGRVSATVVGETGRRQSDRSYLTGGA